MLPVNTAAACLLDVTSILTRFFMYLIPRNEQIKWGGEGVYSSLLVLRLVQAEDTVCNERLRQHHDAQHMECLGVACKWGVICGGSRSCSGSPNPFW